MIATFSIISTSLLAAWLWHHHRSTKRRGGHPLPPGPSPLPIIGNLLQIPSSHMWLQFADWGKKYGPLTYFEILGQPILVINSHQTALDLMEKRGQIYSDRPPSVMCRELSGLEWGLGAFPYNDMLHVHRKLLNFALNARVVRTTYVEIQEKESHKLLLGLLERPDEFTNEIRLCEGAIVLTIAYGFVRDKRHDFIEIGEEILQIFGKATGGYLVDFLPFLKYLPSWLPGAGFKRQATIWKKIVEHGVNAPWEGMKERRASGEGLTCFSSMLLDKNDEDGGGAEGENLIRGDAANLFAAGSDTTQAALRVFILAMVLFPEVQRQAQEEIHRVIGADRLPKLEDKDNLPYLHAVYLETLRWHPIAPLGVPHRLMHDDIYEGQFIPAGTVILPNLWNTSQNPNIYAQPDVFDPSRFIPSKNQLEDNNWVPPLDPQNFGFGFGRRLCPGRHLAETNLWIAMVSILAAFNIRKKLDADGQEITPKLEFQSGLVSPPIPFPCDISPRSERMVELIRAATST